MDKRRFKKDIEKQKYDKKVVELRRVAKVRAGDKLLSFSSLVVVGDRKGRVGIGLGKGGDPQSAVAKGSSVAEKKMFSVQMIGTTIAHEVYNKYGCAKVLIKPAPIGTGIIAGGAVRLVLEVAGIKDVVAKQIGKGNSINNAYCTIGALKMLRKSEKLMNSLKKERVVLNNRERSVGKEKVLKDSAKVVRKIKNKLQNSK